MKQIFTRIFSVLTLMLCLQCFTLAQTTLSDQDVFTIAEENIELYRKGDVHIHIIDGNGKSLKGLDVSIDQLSQDFLFGALLFDLTSDRLGPEREILFKQRFLELFNYGIFPFYWRGYESTPGHPRWETMEEALDWAEKNGVTRKGHPLAWTHEAGMPKYVMNMTFEDSELLLESRIIENVLGFDQISIWDVVNEPANTVTWEMAYADKEGKSRYNHDASVSEIADWVEKAYKAARRAGPDKHLVLNEFRQFQDVEVRNRYAAVLDELLARNTPVDGIGIQGHEPRAEWFDPVEVWTTLEMYSGYDKPIHITEFSPQSKGAAITGNYRAGTWTPETQAEFTEMMYRLWFGHPAVASINWWGFSDANSWLPGCGITTEDLDPKPVYATLKKLIKEEWMTRGLELKSNKKGAVEFRGFFGDYKVMLTNTDGEIQVFKFHLSEGGENLWEIVLE